MLFYFQYFVNKSTSRTIMKPGQRFFCNHCHSQSIAKLERRLEGFTVVEEYLTCAFCHERIAAETPNPSDKPDDAAPKPSLSALESLFGSSKPAMGKAESSVLNELHTAARHFCRDCSQYVKHPFGGRCSLTGKEMEPMDDCPRFERRTDPSQPSDSKE